MLESLKLILPSYIGDERCVDVDVVESRWDLDYNIICMHRIAEEREIVV